MIQPESLVLDGRFRVVSLLSEGGMGEVYLAEQVSLGRKVALKVLRADLSSQRQASDRFRREARLLSSVEHPSVVGVIDFGESEGRPCLVMELAEGETLQEALERGPFPPERAVPVLLQLADGLAAIHEKGIIHRDLKPENVVITRSGRGEHARLLDFGIARLAEPEGLPAPEGGIATASGVILGTPEYVSPEQGYGGRLDARSDLYSFGVLAYRALSGKLPFPGPSPRQFVSQHLSAQPYPLYKAAPELVAYVPLCELVMKCLEKNPANRPQSALELTEALTHALRAPKGEALAPEPPTPTRAAATVPEGTTTARQETPAALRGTPTGSRETRATPYQWPEAPAQSPTDEVLAAPDEPPATTHEAPATPPGTSSKPYGTPAASSHPSADEAFTASPHGAPAAPPRTSSRPHGTPAAPSHSPADEALTASPHGAPAAPLRKSSRPYGTPAAPSHSPADEALTASPHGAPAAPPRTSSRPHGTPAAPSHSPADEALAASPHGAPAAPLRKSSRPYGTPAAPSHAPAAPSHAPAAPSHAPAAPSQSHAEADETLAAPYGAHAAPYETSAESYEPPAASYGTPGTPHRRPAAPSHPPAEPPQSSVEVDESLTTYGAPAESYEPPAAPYGTPGTSHRWPAAPSHPPAEPPQSSVEVDESLTTYEAPAESYEPSAAPYGTPDTPHRWPAAPSHPLAEPPQSSVEVDESLADPYESLADPYESLADPYESLADPYESLADPYAALADPYAALADPYAAPAESYEPSAAPYEPSASPSEPYRSPAAPDPEPSAPAEEEVLELALPATPPAPPVAPAESPPRHPARAAPVRSARRSRPGLKDVPLRVRILVLGALVVAGSVTGAIAVNRMQLENRARAFLDAGQPEKVLELLGSDDAERAPLARVKALRAAALHRLNRHQEELREAAGVDLEAVGDLDGLLLDGLAQDYGRSHGRDQAIRKYFNTWPRDAIRDRFKLIAAEPISPRQWGALRYLDQAGIAQGVNLVERYVTALGDSDCDIRAQAARRLRQLGSLAALEPLEKAAASPGCGQEVVMEAARSLRRRANP